MHAVARNGLIVGLMLSLLAPLGETRAGTAVVGHDMMDAASVGEPAPALSLPSLRPQSDAVRLSDYRGKVVYLDFWSSWCAPCRHSMPHLEALRQEFADELEVLGVNVDAHAGDARRFLEQVRVSYPIGADPAGHVARQFGVAVLPALFVIDAGGVVRKAIRGNAVKAPGELRATLTALIEEREVQ